MIATGQPLGTNITRLYQGIVVVLGKVKGGSVSLGQEWSKDQQVPWEAQREIPFIKFY